MMDHHVYRWISNSYADYDKFLEGGDSYVQKREKIWQENMDAKINHTIGHPTD
jgi:predicted N-acyltransferase